jgi:hypothetical protein
MSSSMSSTSNGPSVGSVLVTVGMELVSQNGSNTLRSPPRAKLGPPLPPAQPICLESVFDEATKL